MKALPSLAPKEKDKLKEKEKERGKKKKKGAKKGNTPSTRPLSGSSLTGDLSPADDFPSAMLLRSLPKIIQERQRLERELRELRKENKIIKRRRERVEHMTRQKILNIQNSRHESEEDGPGDKEGGGAGGEGKEKAAVPKALSTDSVGRAGDLVAAGRRNETDELSLKSTPAVILPTPASAAASRTPTAGAAASATAAAAAAVSDNGVLEGGPGLAEGEGKRFFGKSKYAQFNMDMLQEDRFAQLLSSFQQSRIGEDGEGDPEGDKEKDERNRNSEGRLEPQEIEANLGLSIPQSGELAMLGSFIMMKRDYDRQISEFEAEEQANAADLYQRLEELQYKVTELRRENGQLKAKLQTSQDDAQFLESYSAGVELFGEKRSSTSLIELDNDGNFSGSFEALTASVSSVPTSALSEYAGSPFLRARSNLTEYTSPDRASALAEYAAPTSPANGELAFTRASSSLAEYGAPTAPLSSSPPQPIARAVSSLAEYGDPASAPVVAATSQPDTKPKRRRKRRNAPPALVSLKAYHEIAYEEFQLDACPLGNGAFGVVYKATWRGTAVAVKKLMVMQFSSEEVYNFKREASLMEKYSNHPNVVKFCGICSKFPHYCIITEFMERGCVRDALMKNKDVPWKTIVSMALDAAAGILHLHCERIIHRDLALRNLLVGRDWRVRLADFGLARMMPKETYAKTRGNIGAVRWLAPEVIARHVYSEKSDSYAFGVVMWELLTRGQEPFCDMGNVLEIALGVMNDGLRPKVPPGCPALYQKLMSDCWAQHPEDRPDFAEIHRRLKEYLDTL